eukprot:1434503-Pyramimonas_sp.AAC.1
MWEPITGGKRAYSQCGSQSQGGREPIPDRALGWRRSNAWPELEGCILLLEDVGEDPYKVDRMYAFIKNNKHA